MSDNPALVFYETARRARKDHACCECGNIIAAGDYYKYVHGIWADGPASYKTCWPCVAFRNRDRRLNAGWRDYDAPYLSCLYDDCPREELPAHHPFAGHLSA